MTAVWFGARHRQLSTPLESPFLIGFKSEATLIMVLHQYDYIFAIGTIFSFLDAWNIGTSTKHSPTLY